MQLVLKGSGAVDVPSLCFHHSAAYFMISHEYEKSSCDHMNIKHISVSGLIFLSQLITAAGDSSTHDAPGERLLSQWCLCCRSCMFQSQLSVLELDISPVSGQNSHRFSTRYDAAQETWCRVF